MQTSKQKQGCGALSGLRVRLWPVLLALVTALGLWDLGAVQPVLAAPPGQGGNDFTVETLRNAEYRTLNTQSRTVKLSDGVYEEMGPDGVSSLRITLTDHYAFGDLNGDGVADAAAILATTGGPLGADRKQRLELVALLNQDGGSPQAAASGGLILLGENVQVNALSIANGDIAVDLSRFAPTDEACCPSQRSTSTYISRLGLLVPKQTRSFGQLFPFKQGSLYGYINVLGEMVIEPQFTFAGEFSEGMAPVSYDGQSTGYINQVGELVIEPRYSYGGAFVQGLALVGMPGVNANQPFVTLFIDRVGRDVFGDASFASAEPFSEGLAAVSWDGVHYGYIDLRGGTVIEPQFTHAESFSEGLAPAEFAGKYGFIDHTGRWVIEPQFEAAEPFQGGRAQIVLHGKTGYVNHRGDMTIEPIYDYGHDFHEGRALVALDGKLAYIDAAGNIAIQLKGMDNGGDFSGGMAAVSVNGQHGYIDLQGSFVILPQFSEAADFNDGLAVIQTAEIWGVVNNIGELVLEVPKFTRSIDAATEVVAYAPALPEAIRTGVCRGASNVLGISSAWRCAVDRKEFDPCLLAKDGVTLVCGSAPAMDQAGFRLELAEPLPAAKDDPMSLLAAQSLIWELRADDSSICTLASTITLEIDGRPVTYVCDDGAVLLGDLDRGAATWTAEKAVLANDSQGNFTIDSAKTVGILTAWQPVERKK